MERFPIRYFAYFELFAFDRVSKAILAKLSYTVAIDKKRFDDRSPRNEMIDVRKTIMI